MLKDRSTVFVGLDVHKSSVRMAAMRDGELLHERTLPYDATPLIDELTAWPQVKVCQEAGPTGYGLHRPLRPAGIESTVIGDKGYAGREFEQAAADLHALIVRPRRKDESGKGPNLAPIRQRVESIFQTLKDILILERHGARTLKGIRTRLTCRFPALAAAISLNHQLGRPSRPLINYTA